MLHNVIWASQKAESFVNRWLCPHAMFDVAYFPTFVEHRTCFVDTLIDTWIQIYHQYSYPCVFMQQSARFRRHIICREWQDRCRFRQKMCSCNRLPTAYAVFFAANGGIDVRFRHEVK